MSKLRLGADKKETRMRSLSSVRAFVMAMALASLMVSPAQAQEQSQEGPPCDEIDLGAINIPVDFSITYSSGPVRASRGTRTTTTLNAAGKVTIETARRSRAGEEEKLKRKQVSKDAVRRVYAAVVACHFFELEESYSKPRLRDGWVTSMNVTAAGKSHEVSVRHRSINRFYTLETAFGSATGK